MFYIGQYMYTLNVNIKELDVKIHFAQMENGKLHICKHIVYIQHHIYIG